MSVRKYCTGLDEGRELPERSVEAINDPSALIGLACEEVVPETDRQIDAVAEVIPFLVGSCLPIYRCNEEARSEEELVFRCTPKGIW